VRGLVEWLRDGRYRLTALGRLVVEALSDRGEVARLRGRGYALPAGDEEQ
jgi:hypothetical protein